MKAAVTVSVLLIAFAAHAQDSWRGLRVAPEERCSDYRSGDYWYPQSLEGELTALYGGVYSPYTGEWFDSAADTDIEHIVARTEAHDSGLCAASAESRQAFARDLLNLTLADPGTNRDRKGAKDAAEWLPELNRCWFANRIVAVRQKYDLNIDEAERDELEKILSECESPDLLIHPPGVGPLTGIYIGANTGEGLLLVQDHFGEIVAITLYFEAGPNNEIVPTTWRVDFPQMDEPPAGYDRYFPDAEIARLPETFAE